MIHVRPASEADLAAIMTLNQESHWTPSWSEQAWRQMLGEHSERYIALIAENEAAHVCGFAVAGVVLDVVEIENLAVHPTMRRKGIARGLIVALQREARLRAATHLQLEVNEQNTTAISLYTAMGFREQGRRPGYYDDGLAAVLMGSHL